MLGRALFLCREMQAIKNDATLPLVIGVTGHRNFDAPDSRLEETVRGELRRLGNLYPHSPFLIVSGLAEGADRLVAKLAMETLSAKLIAILPFPEAEYRKDFKSAESQDEFSDLLHKAQAVVIAPQREDAAAVAAGGEPRNRQYARAGAYVVENCQVLIALWDGLAARGVGGTGDVVQWRLTGEMPVEFSCSPEQRNVLWPKPATRLVHIHPATGEVKYVEPDTAPDTALQAMDDYNRELDDFLAQADVNVLNQAASNALGKRAGDSLVTADARLKPLLKIFAAADGLASRNQQTDNKLIFTVALLLFLAMFFSNLTTWKWSMAFYALFLLVIALVARWATRRRIETRFVDYRALAEGLRVAIFWRLGGLPRRVSQNYLNQHLGVVSWIREALASAEMASLTTEAATMVPAENRTALVREAWLQDQADYFDRKVERLQRQTKLLSRYTTAAFFVSWAVAIGKLVGKSAGSGSWLETVTTNLVVLSGPFLAAGIALGFYRQKRALDGVMRRYALSRELYDRAVARLQSGNYPAEVVLLQIGREALNENADWLWLQRATPLKPRR